MCEKLLGMRFMGAFCLRLIVRVFSKDLNTLNWSSTDDNAIMRGGRSGVRDGGTPFKSVIKKIASCLYNDVVLQYQAIMVHSKIIPSVTS